MTNCPFCDRIKAGAYDREQETFVHAVSFTPLTPVTSGHLLVVPRQHVVTPWETPIATADAMFLASTLASRCESSNIIIQAGPLVQTVKHLHIHVIPRRKGDGLKLPWAHHERCGYCYCRFIDAPECYNGCSHRLKADFTGCAEPEG